MKNPSDKIVVVGAGGHLGAQQKIMKLHEEIMVVAALLKETRTPAAPVM